MDNPTHDETEFVLSAYFGKMRRPQQAVVCDPHEAYRILRKNGMKISVRVGKAEDCDVKLTAFTKMDEDGRHAGMVVSVEDVTIEDALIAAARQVCRVASTMQIYAESAGEEDFADFIFL
ncbi:hypothetical protein [Rhizobium sp. 768_B6_N1_8]|uniref:hypothetical protein n=1 Tax=unclassified Rhizobium TaxID=2613769 RepID=UPI003F2403F9